MTYFISYSHQSKAKGYGFGNVYATIANKSMTRGDLDEIAKEIAVANDLDKVVIIFFSPIVDTEGV